MADDTAPRPYWWAVELKDDRPILWVGPCLSRRQAEENRDALGLRPCAIVTGTFREPVLKNPGRDAR